MSFMKPTKLNLSPIQNFGVRSGCLSVLLFATAWPAASAQTLSAQEVTQARSEIKATVVELTKDKYRGRGYEKKGALTAAAYLAKRAKSLNANAVVSFQDFTDTLLISKKAAVTLDGKKLIPGFDFVVEDASASASGTFVKGGKNDNKLVVITESDYNKALSGKKTLPSFDLLAVFSRKPVIGRTKDQYPFPVLFFTDSALIFGAKELKVSVEQAPQVITLRNVIIDIPGLSNDSLLVLTGHYDHLGMQGKAYFPGANDNSSGCAVILQTIQNLYNNPPRFNTRIIFFSGEEAGLLGSKNYVGRAENQDGIKRIAGLINLDLLGTGEEGIMIENAPDEPVLANAFTSELKEQFPTATVKRRANAPNSDHYPFTLREVPAVFMYTLGGSAEYHNVHDTADKLSYQLAPYVSKALSNWLLP